MPPEITGNVIVTLTLRMTDEEAVTLLGDVEAHRRRDEVDGHRDHGVLMLETATIVSVARSEVLS